MRLFEFITESTISLSTFKDRNSHYWRNILDMIQRGADFRLNDGSYVTADPSAYPKLHAIWDGISDTATPEQILLIKDHGFKTIDRKTIGWTKIYKSKEIQDDGKKGANGGPSDESDQKTKFWNLGNVAEGIMGAAVTAKFLNPDKTITITDIVKILKDADYQSSLKVNTTRRTYSGNIRNDKVKFTLSLNQKDYEALTLSFLNPGDLAVYKKHEEIKKVYENAAEYVNTAKTVGGALDRVIGDPNPNSILIESEGASAENQRGTKADIFITIDGKKERLLSLKAGVVSQVGQMSGAAFENLEGFFKSVLGFGLPLSMNNETDFPKDSSQVEVKKYILQNGFMKAYKHIYHSLQPTLTGDNNYKEYNLTSQVFKGLKHHATLDEDVIIVYVSPSAKRAYMEIKIGKELRDALDHFDLKPQLSNTTLKIVGVPIDDLGKEMSDGKTLTLFQMRSSVQGNALRNAVEIGKLVKALADLEKIRSRNGEEPEEKPDISDTPKPNPPQVQKQIPQQQAKPIIAPAPQKTIPAPTAKPVASPQEEPSPYSDQLSQFARPQSTLAPRTDSTWRQKFKRR